MHKERKKDSNHANRRSYCVAPTVTEEKIRMEEEMQTSNGMTYSMEELKNQVQEATYNVDDLSAELAESLNLHGMEILAQHSVNQVYPPGVKIAVVRAYLELGTVSKAAEKVGLPHLTVRKWKSNSPWWNTVEWRMRDLIRTESVSAVGRVIIHGADKMVEMIHDGKSVEKDGRTKKVPLSPKELTDMVKVAVEAQNAAESLAFKKKALEKGVPSEGEKGVDVTALFEHLGKIED